MTWKFSWVLFSFILAGCAWTDVRPVAPSQARYTNGFLYYDPKPILIVDNKGTATITTAANYAQPRCVTQHSFFAKSDAGLTFKDGTLVSVNSNIDTSTIANTAIQTIAPLLLAATSPKKQMADVFQTEKCTMLKPGIYDIISDDAGHIVRLDPWPLPQITVDCDQKPEIPKPPVKRSK